MKRKQTYLILLFLIAVVMPVISAVFIYQNFKYISKDREIPSRKYHIVITGNTENINFLKKVFKGADSISDRYNAVVELYAPSSKAQDTSMQSLFDYALFVNADGIIAYTDEETETIELPLSSTNNQIPVVTIGRYNQDFPQISFIGNNFSESGRLIAKTAFEYSTNTTPIYILNSTNKTPGYSTLMNSLSVSLKNYQMNFTVLEESPQENEEKLLKYLENNKTRSIIVCLSEDDSIHVSRMAADPFFNAKNTIISFGENETIASYFDRGIISAVISVDQEKIGSMAMKELFDYKRTNFANNYVYAGIQVKKGDHSK